MDYTKKQRLKIWVHAKILSLDELKEQGLLDKLTDQDYKARPERGIVFEIKAFDWNCPQHIPQKYTIQEISHALGLRGVNDLKDLKDYLR